MRGDPFDMIHNKSLFKAYHSHPDKSRETNVVVFFLITGNNFATMKITELFILSKNKHL